MCMPLLTNSAHFITFSSHSKHNLRFISLQFILKLIKWRKIRYRTWKSMVIITNNELETVLEGEKLGRTLSPGDVVAMRGGLGAGKTAFIRGLAAGLGVVTSITSPTFTIVNECPGKIPLFHFDMYRIGNENELHDIGWDDYLNQGGVCAVEWSENIQNALPHNAIVVQIESLGGDIRRLEIYGVES